MGDSYQEPNYIGVWIALVVLTIFEVGITYVSGIDRFTMILGLLVMAFTKAGLVALWYMHLKFEGKLIYLVCAAPTVLVAVLIGGSITDVGRSEGILGRVFGPAYPRTEMRDGQILPVNDPLAPSRPKKPSDDE